MEADIVEGDFMTSPSASREAKGAEVSADESHRLRL